MAELVRIYLQGGAHFDTAVSTEVFDAMVKGIDHISEHNCRGVITTKDHDGNRSMVLRLDRIEAVVRLSDLEVADD